MAPGHSTDIESEVFKLPVVRVLRCGGGAFAALRLVKCRGGVALLKDFSRSSALFRKTFGAYMIYRELAAYRRLNGVSGVPRLIGSTGRNGLLLEYVEGLNCETLSGYHFPQDFFDRLLSILRAIRSRGVLHGDIRRNVLINPSGAPVLVDFGSSFVVPRWLYPIRSLILHVGGKYQERSVAKLKRRVAPGLLTAEERSLLAQRMPFEFFVKPLERLIRSGTGCVIRLSQRQSLQEAGGRRRK
ncbi:MAG TPA: hypothetical protein VGL91_17185 [Acidobacteriota bacterium]|jgi:hypothetical protein